ncbi:MAG: HepT-like ribonuclease domain-containing protein [Phycisphaerales bacterium]
MQHSAKTRLHDILQAATHIQSYVQDKSLQDYLQSRMLRAAVEREFEIIGEALRDAIDPHTQK